MNPVSQKNKERYPELSVGDPIIVRNAKIPMLNESRGIVHEVKRVRSPYKSMVAVNLEGKMAFNNPWYLFRVEVEKL